MAWKWALYLLLTLGFVAIGISMMLFGGTNPSAFVVGLVCVLFFGAGVPLFGWNLLDRRPVVVLDGGGIFDRRLGVGIPWSEIEGAYPATVQHRGGTEEFVCLQLRNPEPYAAKLPRRLRLTAPLNNAVGFTEFAIATRNLDTKTEDLLAEIAARANLEPQRAAPDEPG